jgi:hypothetical protein
LAARHWIIRCTYRSLGGDLLAIDSRPLCFRAAVRLRRRVSTSAFELVEVLQFPAQSPRPLPDGVRRAERLDRFAAFVEAGTVNT